jgi:hypothetical protein
MRDAFESASEEEREKIKSNFYSEFQNLDPLDPGEVAGKEIWIRIPTDINSLKEINNLYNIKEAGRSYKNLLKISNNFYNLCKIASEEVVLPYWDLPQTDAKSTNLKIDGS